MHISSLRILLPLFRRKYYLQSFKQIYKFRSFGAMSQMKFIDIGVNLIDGMYQGVYHGKQKHEADLNSVIQRAVEGGVEKIIVTGTSLSESEAALELCEKYDNLFCTVGCHPTNCDEFEKESPEEYYQKLKDLAFSKNKKIIALGEFGLDYDRLNFCSMEVQKKYFEQQLKLAAVTHLPMFLHCRKAAKDLVEILQSCGEDLKLSGGVVHSFDGTTEEMEKFLSCGFYIGINGCSLKTEENLKVVKEIPLERLLLETDSPWCEIRPSHAGYKYIKSKFPSKKYDKWEKGVMVKGRNEPHCIVQVLEVVAAVREEDPRMVAEKVYENTCTLFKF